MNEIIKEVRTKDGYKMGRKDLNIIRYADDVVLMADNEDDLQRLLYSFYLGCQKYNMKISLEKTKSMTISKIPFKM